MVIFDIVKDILSFITIISNQMSIERPDIKLPPPPELEYAYWRKDKPAEPGFTRELIPKTYDFFAEYTNMEDMDAWFDKSLNTIYKGLVNLYNTMPNHPLLGTKVVTEVAGKKTPKYEWTNVKDVVDGCKHFAAGCKTLGVLPTV